MKQFFVTLRKKTNLQLHFVVCAAHPFANSIDSQEGATPPPGEKSVRPIAPLPTSLTHLRAI